MGKVAIAFGSFDILHPGHIKYLESASRYGKLVVIVGRDASIKKLKGRPPVMDEQSRLMLIRSLRFVDKATLGARIGRWNDIYNILLKYRPDYIVLGYDQKVDMPFLMKFIKKNKLNSRIIRLKPFKETRFKSSVLKKLMSKSA